MSWIYLKLDVSRHYFVDRGSTFFFFNFKFVSSICVKCYCRTSCNFWTLKMVNLLDYCGSQLVKHFKIFSVSLSQGRDCSLVAYGVGSMKLSAHQEACSILVTALLCQDHFRVQPNIDWSNWSFTIHTVSWCYSKNECCLYQILWPAMLLPVQPCLYGRIFAISAISARYVVLSFFWSLYDFTECNMSSFIIYWYWQGAE
jgi:hypothetical protein